ncbi:hypothetical protein KC19_1G309900, partial [Ceratodon purpureus]
MTTPSCALKRLLQPPLELDHNMNLPHCRSKLPYTSPHHQTPLPSMPERKPTNHHKINDNDLIKTTNQQNQFPQNSNNPRNEANAASTILSLPTVTPNSNPREQHQHKHYNFGQKHTRCNQKRKTKLQIIWNPPGRRIKWSMPDEPTPTSSTQ